MAKLFEAPRYVAIEGPVCVGKTSLATAMADRLCAQKVLDGAAHPFLKAFHDGDEGAGFKVQLSTLIERFELLRTVEQSERSRVPVVTDFIFDRDKLFACLNLSDEELSVYNHYFTHFKQQLANPDLVVYLQANADVLKKRLKKKGMGGLSDDYLEEIVKAYDHFFFHYSASDLLVVNAGELDLQGGDMQGLLQKVSEPIRGTQYFLPLGAADRSQN